MRCTSSFFPKEVCDLTKNWYFQKYRIIESFTEQKLDLQCTILRWDKFQKHCSPFTDTGTYVSMPAESYSVPDKVKTNIGNPYSCIIAIASLIPKLFSTSHWLKNGVQVCFSIAITFCELFDSQVSFACRI